MSLANGSGTRDAATRPGNVRGQLVAALAAVPGITAYPVVPDQATAGAAWPKWIRTDYQNGKLCNLAVDTYDVLVTLPAAYVEVTVDQGDAFRDVVAGAVFPVGQVQTIEPVSVTFQDRQTMPALRLRVVI